LKLLNLSVLNSRWSSKTFEISSGISVPVTVLTCLVGKHFYFCFPVRKWDLRVGFADLFKFEADFMFML